MRREQFKELGQLRIGLSDIGDPGNCPLDGAPARRAMITYEYRVDPVDETDVGIAVYRKLPGFECTLPKDSCGLDWPDGSVHRRFLQAVAIGLNKDGNSQLADHSVQPRPDSRDPRINSPRPPGFSA